MFHSRFHLTRRSLSAIGVFAIALAAAAQAPSGQPVIKDRAEYTAYSSALNAQNGVPRAEAFEAFVQQYPKSVALADALEQEMAAWQAAGNSARVKSVAKRLLAIDQGNIRALGIVVALDRASAEQGDTNALNEMCVDASGGMLAVPMWRKPAGMTNADYNALSRLMNGIFIGAEGYCAVEQKNYSQGRDWLARAVRIDPTNVADTYQLAVADLESTPMAADGFWYCARAIHLAQSAATPQDATGMTAYCKAKYAKYHGAEDGWDALAGAVASQDELPANFANSIKPAQAK